MDISVIEARIVALRETIIAAQNTMITLALAAELARLEMIVAHADA